MNRGAWTYYKEGMKLTFKTFKKLENYMKYYCYLIISFICLIIPLGLPIAELANNKIARMTKEDQKYRLFDIFDGANSKKPFLQLLVALFIKILTILSGIVIIGFFTFLLAFLGYGIGYLFTGSFSLSILSDLEDAYADRQMVFAILFALPGILVLLIYLICIKIRLSPVAFISANNPNYRANEILSISVNSTSRTGKWTIFILSFLTLLVKALYFALAYGITYYMTSVSQYIAVYVLGFIVAIIFILFALFLFPVLTTAKNVAIYSLFEDTVLDKFNNDKKIIGLSIQKVKYYENKKTKKYNEESIETELVALFDNEDEMGILSGSQNLSGTQTTNQTDKNYGNKVNHQENNINIDSFRNEVKTDEAIKNAVEDAIESEIKIDEIVENAVEDAIESEIKIDEIVENTVEEAIETEVKVDEIVENTVEETAETEIKIDEIVENTVEDAIETEVKVDEIAENTVEETAETEVKIDEIAETAVEETTEIKVKIDEIVEKPKTVRKRTTKKPIEDLVEESDEIEVKTDDILEKPKTVRKRTTKKSIDEIAEEEQESAKNNEKSEKEGE